MLVKHFRVAVGQILEEAAQTIRKVDDRQIARLIDFLVDIRNNNRKIFVVGAGRSGLVGRSFAVRLAQMSFNVYVVGETIAPSIEKKDALFVISGSGETKIVLTYVKLAREVGAQVVAVTSFVESSLTSLCDHYVVLQGRTKIIENKRYFSRQISGINEPLAPLGTIFELSSTIFLDGLIAAIMVRLNKTELELMKRHATME